MSENTINAALRRLRYSGDDDGARLPRHGLHAAERKRDVDARCERALAHGHSDATRGAYARGQHCPERVAMAQWWSDYPDTLRKGADVVSYPHKETA